MRLSRPQWEKLLLRWTKLEATGEVKLICAVLADGIVEREKDKWFFDGAGFDSYCRVLGLNPQFVREQILTACEYEEVEAA